MADDGDSGLGDRVGAHRQRGPGPHGSRLLSRATSSAIRSIVGGAILAAAPATAQTPEEAAAMNMQLALETCMRHQGLESELPEALAAVGFDVSPGMDAGAFELKAPGIHGLVGGEPGSGYCTIQSESVPLALAEAIGAAVGNRLFPGKVVAGAPEGSAGTAPEPCEGYSIWDARPVITVSYAQAGNSGECVNDGTSAIILRM